jgi:hypothetical protein
MNIFYTNIIKCACQAFIIQNLDIMTLELSMKVCDFWKYHFNLTNYAQFAKF